MTTRERETPPTSLDSSVAGPVTAATQVAERPQASTPPPGSRRLRWSSHVRALGSHLAGWLPGPGQTLILLLVAAGLLRALWLESPDRSLIFDEQYYVNAARVLAGIPVGADQSYAD